MLDLFEQIVKLSPSPSSIDMLSPAPVPASASVGVELFFQFIVLTASLCKTNQTELELSKAEPELGTAQPQLVSTVDALNQKTSMELTRTTF